MITFLLNNKNVVFNAQYTILQAGVNSGIIIPKFCYHPRLSIAGNCRMCLVQLDHSVKLVASCAMGIANGIKVTTNSNVVRKAREAVLEFLLINHPLDCPVCDQGGECDLQDQTIVYGGDRGRFYEKKRAVADINLGPVVKTFMSRCIHCTRCIRFLSETTTINNLGLIGRGNNMRISTFLNKPLITYLAGNVADICPVGALTSKPYAFSARPWEITKKETLDFYELFGENVRIDFKGTEILRVLPLEKFGQASDWITDKSRLFFDGVLKQKVSSPALGLKQHTASLSWEQVFFILNYVLKVWANCSSLHISLCVDSTTLTPQILMGPHIEFEAILVLKLLQNLSKLSHNFVANSPSKFFLKPIFKSNYLLATQTKLSMPAQRVLLFINFEPSNELATFNSILKKELNLNKIIGYRVGLCSYPSNDVLPFNSLGLSPLTTYSIIKGKNGVCRLFLRFMLKQNEQKHSILFGSAFGLRHDAPSQFLPFFYNISINSVNVKFLAQNYTQLNVFESYLQ